MAWSAGKWLTGVFVLYGISGYLLVVNSASFPSVAVVSAWAGGGAAAWTWVIVDGTKNNDRTCVFLGVWLIAWGCLMALKLFFVNWGWVGLGIIVPILVGAIIGIAAREVFLKSFSTSPYYLILSITNLSGLGSGSLLGFLLHSKG